MRVVGSFVEPAAKVRPSRLTQNRCHELHPTMSSDANPTCESVMRGDRERGGI